MNVPQTKAMIAAAEKTLRDFAMAGDSYARFEHGKLMDRTYTLLFDSPEMSEMMPLVHKAYGLMLDRGPDVVSTVHDMAKKFALYMNSQGADSVDALKEVEADKRLQIEAFAAGQNAQLLESARYTNYKSKMDRLLLVIENLSKVPDDKYTDADALLGALKASFPEKPVNPLRPAFVAAPVPKPFRP